MNAIASVLRIAVPPISVPPATRPTPKRLTPSSSPNAIKKSAFVQNSFYLKCLKFGFLAFCGCTRVYKPVYIPTKCNIPKLERPALNSPSLSANIRALLIYTEALEQDVRFCIEGQGPLTQKKEHP
ncbi:hypothetical protein HHE02_12240 [Helicobacter heilmannii]|nr:hypothetical protein HHE02_12240 [Helicobacter heilmannii]